MKNAIKLLTSFFFFLFLFLIFPIKSYAILNTMEVDIDSVNVDMNGVIHFITEYPDAAYPQPDMMVSVTPDTNGRIEGLGGHCMLIRTKCIIQINSFYINPSNPIPGEYVYFIAYKNFYSNIQYVSQPIPTSLLNIILPKPSILLSSTGFSNPEALLTKDEDQYAIKNADTASFTVAFDPPAIATNNIVSTGFTNYGFAAEMPEGVECSAVLHTDQGDFPSYPIGPGCAITQGYSDNSGFGFELPDSVHQIDSVTWTISSPPGAYFPYMLDYLEFHGATLTDNFRPTVSIDGPYTVGKGQSIQLHATASDPDNDSLSYAWDLNNDNSYEYYDASPTFSAATLSPGIYPVRVRVSDNDLEVALSDSDETTVTVVTTVDAGGPYSVNVGDSVQLQASSADPGSEIYTYAWDLDNNGSFETPGQTVDFLATGLTPGDYTIKVQATDPENNTAVDEAIITVNIPQPMTVTFNASADTYIRSGQDNHNYGAGVFMNLQSSGSNRSLVKFDQSELQNAIGSGTVLSAKLQLTIVDNGNNWGNTGRTVDLHRMIESWDEGNGTENARGTGAGNTWNCANDSNINNQAKNCSGSTEWEMGQPNNPSVHPWNATTTDTKTITNNQSGVVEFDVTSDIQSFMNGTNNYGWLLKKTNEGQNGQVSFGTRESSSVPQLIVTYQP